MIDQQHEASPRTFASDGAVLAATTEQAMLALRSLMTAADADAIVLARAGMDDAAAARLIDALTTSGVFAVLVGDDKAQVTVRPEPRLDAQLTHLVALLIGRPVDERPTTAENLEESGRFPSPVAAGAAGMRPLAEAHPVMFETCLATYRGLLVAALEQRAYRITRNLRPGLVALAEDLAALGADPRDCVQLQSRVLRDLAASEDPGLVEVARDEGMVLLVELLGYLARSYRDGRRGELVRAVAHPTG